MLYVWVYVKKIWLQICQTKYIYKKFLLKIRLFIENEFGQKSILVKKKKVVTFCIE